MECQAVKSNDRLCPGCDAAFVGKRKNSTFCSTKCYVADWHKRHQDRVREHKRNHQNSDTGRVKRASWASNNKVKIAESARERYLGNKQERIDSATKWNRNNRERRREIVAKNAGSETGKKQSLEKRWRRIARVKNAPGRGLTMDQFYEICADHEDHCLMCLRQFERSTLTIDHVVPISCGGAHDVDNIQPLCSRCNKQKGTLAVDFRPTFWWRGPSKGIAL